MINLVTTRDQKYWPKEGENILIGPGVLPDEKVFCNNSNIKMLPPLYDQNNRLKVIKDIDNYYEKILDIMVKVLNIYHNVSYSKRYWRLIIGPYLFFFVNAIYEKKIKIDGAIKEYSTIHLPFLKNELYIDIYDYSDFINKISSDELYSSQLISRIISASKKNYRDNLYHINEYNKKKWEMPNIQETKYSVFSRIRRRLYKQINKIFSKKAYTLLYFSALPALTLAKLEAYSKGKISHLYEKTEQPRLYGKKVESRKKLHNIMQSFLSMDDFINLVLNILSNEIPTNIIEGYNRDVNNSIKEFKKYSPKKIGSGTGWYTGHTSFLLWAAEMSEKGTKILGLQHGGNYGVLRNHFHTLHEIKISDEYFTWGWKVSEKQYKKIPVSIMLDHKKSTLKNQDILFVTTDHIGSYINHMITPESSLKYVKDQLTFLKNCSEKVKLDIKVRLYSTHLHWPIKKEMNSLFPTINFDSKRQSFIDTLLQCRVYVCDHLSTTYIQSFIINKPTILFWDPTETILEEAAIPYFDSLKKIKVLHDTPESAAKWLSEIKDNIEVWWFCEENQKTIQIFCRHYAYSTRQPIKELKEAFLNNKRKKEEG